MKIEYKDKKIARICTDKQFAEKKYGRDMMVRIQRRVNLLMSFESVEELLKYKEGRCHKLKGNRKEQYALDLVHPYRLIFEKKDDKVQIAYILEIVDYH